MHRACSLHCKDSAGNALDLRVGASINYHLSTINYWLGTTENTEDTEIPRKETNDGIVVSATNFVSGGTGSQRWRVAPAGTKKLPVRRSSQSEGGPVRRSLGVGGSTLNLAILLLR